MSNPKREFMLLNIEKWNESNEHEKILAEINTIPREFWDYEVTSLYARALNNLEQYEEALDFLMTVKTQGRNDGIWHFRTGYSLYFLGREEEAAEYIGKAIDLGDERKDTKDLLGACLKEAEFKKNNPETNNVISYSEDEMKALDNHIEKFFGVFENVFHEIISHDIHVDIVVIEPTPKRNYYVLVTMGMGAKKMNVPDELKDLNLTRAELLVCLPPDWKLDSLDDEKWYWPLRWLKILARLPIEENSWLGFGHTIPNGAPFAENTSFGTILLGYPNLFGKKSMVCKLPNGEEVNFYQLIPLYNEEVEYKLKNNAEALLKLMGKKEFEFVKLDRKNVIN